MTAKEFLENKNIKEPTYEGVRLVDNKMGTYRIVELLEEYHQAKLKLLGIANVSKRSWAVGETVMITDCIYGHEFDIGVKAEIVDYEPSQTTSWLCRRGQETWYLSEDEGYVC